MAKKKQKSKQSVAARSKTSHPAQSGADTDFDAESADAANLEQGEELDDAAEDGVILDYITGERVEENGKELVRRKIARALFHQYGIPVDCMERDFAVKIKGEGTRTTTV